MEKVTIAKVFSLNSSLPYFSTTPKLMESYGKAVENQLKQKGYEVEMIEEPLSYDLIFLQAKRWERVGEMVKGEDSLREFLLLNPFDEQEPLIFVVNFLMKSKGYLRSFLTLTENKAIFGCIYERKFFHFDFYSKRIELEVERLFSRVPTSSPETYLEEVRKLLENYQRLPSPPPSAGKIKWESEFNKTLQSLRSLYELARYDLPPPEFERFKKMTKDLLEGSKVFNPFIYELFKI